jgi:hypothetical protein
MEWRLQLARHPPKNVRNEEAEDSLLVSIICCNKEVHTTDPLMCVDVVESALVSNRNLQSLFLLTKSLHPHLALYQADKDQGILAEIW